MHPPSHPSDIAREALKRLAARHLQPTPANFATCYNEIAGDSEAAFFPEAALRRIAAACGGQCAAPEQRALLLNLNAAIGRASWSGVQDALLALLAATTTATPAEAAPPPTLPGELAARLARLVEAIPLALGGDERLARVVGELTSDLRAAQPAIAAVEAGLGRLVYQVAFVAEEQQEIKATLLKLLQLILVNIGELSIDDSWLKGQVDGLLAAVAPPLTLRHLDEMERRLREVMEKQSRAKARTVAAQQEMRQMLATFVERLAEMNRSSESFRGRIEASARRLESVRGVEELTPLLAEIIAASRDMVDDSARSRDQLESLQERVLATEAELVQLHIELDNASALARHDPLTDALNRKGLDEVMLRELAVARRQNAPLTVSLLDIDNFKRLNDRLGHAAGDQALIHLAEVARAAIRPSDALARYGGEEFVVVMPDTSAEHGAEIMRRLQRELTKAIFMADKEKVLITFSAGVAQLRDGEAGQDAIQRADRAMYLAKRAGKNRVMIA